MQEIMENIPDQYHDCDPHGEDLECLDAIDPLRVIRDFFTGHRVRTGILTLRLFAVGFPGLRFFAAAVITVIIYLARIAMVWFTIPRSIPASDAAIIAVMEPKGLAAAVLASLPLQAGIAAGQTIQDVTYIVIFFSILVCSVMVFLLERTCVYRGVPETVLDVCKRDRAGVIFLISSRFGFKDQIMLL